MVEGGRRRERVQKTTADGRKYAKFSLAVRLLCIFSISGSSLLARLAPYEYVRWRLVESYVPAESPNRREQARTGANKCAERSTEY